MGAVASPEKAEDSCTTAPTALNLILAAGYVALNLFQFLLLPIVLLPLSPWWGLALIPIAFLNNPFWSLIHEAIHDLLHPSQRMNALVGRALSIVFGAPFRVLRLSHLLHHKLNRTPLEATELYDPKRTSRLRASLGYYFYILGGLYLLEALSPLLFFLPRRILSRMQQSYFSGESLGGLWFRSLANREAIREIRIDGVLILALLTVSFVYYGENRLFFFGSLMARAFLVSFLDNVYHYKTPINHVFYARNLWLPSFASKAFLYFNLHGVHHQNPAIPWNRLPEAFNGRSEGFAANFFTAAFQQLYGTMSMLSLPPKHEGGS